VVDVYCLPHFPIPLVKEESMFGLSRADRRRRKAIERNRRVRKQAGKLQLDIDENCPLLQCVVCDYEFDGDVGTECPGCGSGATLKHVLRRSARL
jgi:hypothetical protein